MGFNPDQFLGQRAQSAISSILDEPTKQVSTDSIPEPQDEPVINPLKAMYNRFIGDAPGSDHPYGVGDAADKAYVPLTAEELKAAAQSKTEMWAALMSLVICGAKTYAAGFHLKPGDKALIDEHERRVMFSDDVPAYTVTDPYHAARERYDRYQELLDDAEKHSVLDDGKKGLLYKAVYAHLKAEDHKKTLKQQGIYSAVLEITLAMLAESLMILITQLITSRFVK